MKTFYVTIKYNGKTLTSCKIKAVTHSKAKAIALLWIHNSYSRYLPKFCISKIDIQFDLYPKHAIYYRDELINNTLH